MAQIKKGVKKLHTTQCIQKAIYDLPLELLKYSILCLQNLNTVLCLPIVIPVIPTICICLFF